MDVKRFCCAIFMLSVVVWEQRTHAENVRLVGGATNAEGRLEVYHDNQWGTVCDDDFDANVASVVCKMLGLPSAGAYPTKAYGGGNGTIWLDDIHCDGNETDLLSCNHVDWGDHNCGHSEDVGVVCREEIDVGVRLVDGYSSLDGVVEVRVNETWRPVCFTGITDDSTLSIICRMLGFDNLQAVTRYEERRLQGMEPFGFRRLRCSSEIGTQHSFVRCYNSGMFLSDCSEPDSGILRIFCIADCPLIRHCKSGRLTCHGRNSSVCNECEDEYQLTRDNSQCRPKQKLCIGQQRSGFGSGFEFPVFISGWACAVLLSIVLVITCVCYRIRVRKSSLMSSNDQQREAGSRAVKTPLRRAEEECHAYEVPSRSGQQAVVYEIPDDVYEEVK